MKSAILSVGTELLFGQVTNTNTVFLSQRLNLMGIDVMYHSTVGDNPARAKQDLSRLLEEVDLVITTGGLGPTQDDLTKEMAAEVMGVDLVLDEEALKTLKSYFEKSGRVMTENNIKQVMLPEKDGFALPNNCGTAPGCVYEKNGKTVICLPGPPREMKQMFEESVVPYLQKRVDAVIFSRMIRTFGIGESQLEFALQPVIDGQTDPTVATYAKEGESSVRVTSKRRTEEEARAAVDEMVGRIKEIVGEYIYSCDDEDLSGVVVKKLTEKGLTLSSAESCTGGLFASTVISNDGASAVFDRSLVTYSNRAKVEELGVKEVTLQTYGAVSAETAGEMAEGLSKVSGSDICVAVTGIAGPDGGTKEKPVGLVYIGLTYEGKTVAKEFKVRPVGRNWIRNYTVMLMLNEILSLIK